MALGLRLLLWSQPLHQLANDEIEYVTVARDLLAGRGWQFYNHYHWLRAPLYPLFLAASLWLAGGDLHRAALPNIALSVATVYLSYRLAHTLVGQCAALLAASLAALLLTLATFASLYMAETLFTFLFTAALLCLVRRRTTDDGRRTTDDGRQTTDDRRRTTDERQTTDDRRRTTDDGRQATGKSNRWSVVGGRWSVVMAGVLFGLATLTRSVSLLFLPIIALWLLLRTEDSEHRANIVISPRAVACSLSFVLCSLLMIAPWFIRNQIAYGRVIVVETGLSYNLWAFNEPREDEQTIFRILENIPNPAERSDYATAKGLARLREDPMILVRKLLPNWIYLWRVKPIEDRFIQASYYSDVGLPLFASALVFDDALYLVIALAGVAGLALCFRNAKGSENKKTSQGQRAGNFTQRRKGAKIFASPAAVGTRRLCVKPPGMFYFSRVPNRQKTSAGSLFQNLRSKIQNPTALLIAWLLYAIATMLLTHAEARYRQLLFPALIPYAAWAILRIAKGKARRVPTHHLVIGTLWVSSCHLVIAALWLTIAGVALVYYPWDWAGQNLARGWHALSAEIAWSAGARDAALRADERALEAQTTPDGWIRLGDHARAMGDSKRALSAYREAVDLTPPYIAAVAHRGDLLRETGDTRAARNAFDGEHVDHQQLTDWSWLNLRPAATAFVDVGDGLDYGYVGGMYPAERQQGVRARWSNGDAWLRLRAIGQTAPGPITLRLRLAAPRPDSTSTPVQVCVEGRCQSLRVGPTWRIYVLSFDITQFESPIVEVRGTAFQAPDGRMLDVLIDWARIDAAG